MAGSRLRLGSRQPPSNDFRNGLGSGMAVVLKETRPESDTDAFSDHVKKHSGSTWRLELLGALHAKGLVSDEEFEAKRGKILATV